MYKIVSKKRLNETVTMMEIEAPLVARKAEAGQFVILRADEDGERIPLTIAGYDRAKGTVRIIFQTVGGTTVKLSRKEAGESISDFVGPLGKATDTEGIHRAIVVGGGVGTAIALPVAEKLNRLGAKVHSVIGFRNRELVILEEEFSQISDTLSVMTDDGSYGSKGFVTDSVRAALSSGESFDAVFAIGPLPMMKAVVETVRPFGVKVVVSMNPVMIDGTGMCGGCRLTVGGKMKFACVDGPDFNGYEVDFDEAMMRAGMYGEFERHAYESACNLFKKEGGERE